VTEIVEAAVAQFVAQFMTKRASRGGGSAGAGAGGDSEGMRRLRAEREEAQKRLAALLKGVERLRAGTFLMMAPE
jgi:hypothetical protein